MPQITALPTRANAFVYDEDIVQEVVDLLYSVRKGQGVDILDEPVDTPQKARVKGRKMQEALKRDHDIDVRVHVATVEEPVTTGPKAQHTTGLFMPMVSPKGDLPDRETEDDAPEGDE